MTLLYIFAFIGVWYSLSIAVLLVLVGVAEYRRERISTDNEKESG